MDATIQNGIALNPKSILTKVDTTPTADSNNPVSSDGVKTYVDQKDQATNIRVDTLNTQIAASFFFKGSSTFAELPVSGNTVNDTYYVTDSDKECWYSWNGTDWIKSSMSQADYAGLIAQLKADISAEYSTSKTYKVGDYCLYGADGVLYICKIAVTTAGAFDSNKWQAISFGEAVGDLVIADDTQPTSLANKIWLDTDPNPDTVEVITEEDLGNIVAGEFDSASAYAVGDYCIHDAKLYVAKTATAVNDGWIAARWQQVTVMGTINDQVGELKTQSNNFENDLEAINLYKYVDIWDESFDVSWTDRTHAMTLRHKVDLKSGQTYYLHITDGGIHYKPSQFVRIWSAAQNSTSSDPEIFRELFRSESLRADGDIDMKIVPTMDAPWLLINFYIEADESAGNVSFKLFTTEIWDKMQYADPYFDVVDYNIDSTFPIPTPPAESNFATYIPVDVKKGVKYRVTVKPNEAEFRLYNAVRIWTANQPTYDAKYMLDNINNSGGTNPICGTLDKADLPIGALYEEVFTASYNADYLVVRLFGDTSTHVNVDISISACTPLSDLGDMVTNDDVVKLNKDVEPLVLQFGRELSTNMATDIGKPNRRLTFVHFSDIHAKVKLWKRICEYMNYYKDIIKFAIHTGDYVATDLSATSVVDLYGMEKPLNPILNVVGNHDCMPAGGREPNAPISDVHNALYASVDPSPEADKWGCEFSDEEYAMYWYKDIADDEPEDSDYIPTKIRIIAVDQYHWTTAQATFISNAFDGARANGYAVITCSHEPFEPNAADVASIGSGFWTLDPWKTFSKQTEPTDPLPMLRGYINSFISGGGEYIMHLCGHIHSDQAGTIDNQNILQWRTMAGTNNIDWQDSNRVPKTKTWDCFNVIQVDRTLGTVSLVRIGCNSDDHMQAKNAFCYDYKNHRLISSQ